MAAVQQYGDGAPLEKRVSAINSAPQQKGSPQLRNNSFSGMGLHTCQLALLLKLNAPAIYVPNPDAPAKRRPAAPRLLIFPTCREKCFINELCKPRLNDAILRFVREGWCFYS
ncbi:hypothetical protein CEXT_474991 [Caerostris extrusa]|uniref:Uncharacterized protein n=1 Tax=Caerostris extrusa TaxID=172846 RepID=A0AAV4N1Q3_CAEEX|nr:hypothetical protein CEXT_474991 [Caerostris extrusa]